MGAAAGAGLMTRVQEGVGKGVTSDGPPNPAWHGYREVEVKGRQGRRERQRDKDLNNGVSGEGRA